MLNVDNCLLVPTLDEIMKVEVNSRILFEAKILNAIQVINRTLDTYDASEIFLSFNGGKDCTVLLDLMSKLFVEKFPTKRLLCLYIQPENPFDEIEEFIKDCERQYKIEVKAIRGTVKGALDEICKQNSSRLKVCVMGCRRTDPHCENLNEYQETDPGWPPLLRVNPLLEWTCKDIWQYLHEHNVPYCSLYKMGYTSIGDKTNTLPNPTLKRRNSVNGNVEYAHADQLIDMDHLERAGRI